MNIPTSVPITARRALATREAAWAASVAHGLARLGVQPNAVSLASVVAALVAGVAFVAAAVAPSGDHAVWLIVAAVSIQLRLLCNLLDGMLAVEEGLGAATGPIYNELPDRAADVVILVGAGYALQAWPYGPVLGWVAAVCALGTAYVRALAGSLGRTQSFAGPMAKQHRMALLTAATLLAAVEAWFGRRPDMLLGGLITIVAGSVVTIVRRVRHLAEELEAR